MCLTCYLFVVLDASQATLVSKLFGLDAWHFKCHNKSLIKTYFSTEKIFCPIKRMLVKLDVCE